MRPLDPQKRSEILDNLISAAVSCPVDHCNPVDCPLHELRKLELGRRLEWFRVLTDDELVYLNSYHFVCMQNRLKPYLSMASDQNTAETDGVKS